MAGPPTDSASLHSELTSTSHVFLELTSLDELSFPTSSSSRIKYTCLDASPHYLAVGSSSGTVYLFSRYASKYSSRLSSVPVQVVSTRDGAIVKVAISPDEKYLASAGQRGPLTVSTLSSNGHSPAAVVCNTCHVGNVDGNRRNHVTELRWSDDSRKVYAGDVNGQVSCTRVQDKSVFRSPCSVLLETDSSVVQLDVRERNLLVSTLTRCCLCDLTTLACIQVGKKLRHGRFGAMFYKMSWSEPTPSDPSNQAPLIFSSRPNGRLWEANSLGVVYSTHQYRNLANVAHHGVISFKEESSGGPSETCDYSGDKHLVFGKLHRVSCSQTELMLTQNSHSLYLIDPANGRFVLACDLDERESVDEYAVCGSDVFVLCERTGKLRKLTVFPVEKAVEKLHWKKCFNQAAELINVIAPQMERSGEVSWRADMLQDILVNLCTKESMETCEKSLRRMIALSEQHKPGTSTNSATMLKPRAVVHRLNTGIHRVVRIMDNSGYEDDFTFRAPSPLRLRSKSTPNMEASLKSKAWKRRSLPLQHNNEDEEQEAETAGGAGQDSVFDDGEKQDMEKEKDRINKESTTVTMKNLKALVSSGSEDSLRTLLAGSQHRVTFDSQVTLGDVPNDLAAAKKLLRLIADDEEYKENAGGAVTSEEKQTEMRNGSADFTSLFGRRDPLEGLGVWQREAVSVERLRIIKRPRRGARIVKAIKPSGKQQQQQQVDKTSTYNQSDAEATVDLALATSNGESEPNSQLNPPQALDSDLAKMPTARLVVTNQAKVMASIVTKQRVLTTAINEKTKRDETSTLISPSYVIENNFIPDRTVKMSWTMPNSPREEQTKRGFGKKESENVEEEDLGQENEDADERLMEMSEVMVQPSELEVLETSEDLGRDCCESCSLHSSWRVVLAFGPVMWQLKVVQDEFERGGVPACREQWRTVMLHRVNAGERTELNELQLCADCASFFDFSIHIKRKLALMKDWLVRAQARSSQEKRTAASEIRKTALSWQGANVRSLFFARPSDDRESCQSASSSDSQPNEDHGRDRLNGEERIHGEITASGNSSQHSLTLLPALTLAQLLFCMRLCEGMESVLSILKEESQIRNSLTDFDWQWLAAMKARDAERWKEILPKQVVDGMLSELEVKSVKDSASQMSDSKRLSSNGKQLSSSILIVEGNCPCCTLPLAGRVSDTDCFVTTFQCGHSYHKVCLREANVTRCIRCEIERRRQRQQTTAQSVSRTSPRLAPVRATRVNVTMPQKIT